MNKIPLLGMIIALIFFVTCYFATNSLLASGVVSLLTVVYFFVFLKKRFHNFRLKVTRFHDCYCFINNFIISLSISGSVSGAFKIGCQGITQEFDDELEAMKEMRENEKITYLERYFPFHLYQLFVDVVNLWCEQGGDIIKMSSYVNNEARETEDYIVHCERCNRKVILEFSILWAFALAIIFILRLVLSDFYHIIVKQAIFVFGIISIFIMVLLSIEILTKKMTNLQIRGWSYENQ